ncbi:MAG: Na+/H+ antiporter subunit E [Bowdeniella nasicola]|nr:Na+/H+ antiporter subunit E [Bowdeniella nasicola]
MSNPKRPWHGRGPASIFLIGWLTLVWVLLWGTVTWGNIVNGLVIALLVTTLLPLPRLSSTHRVRPLAVAHLVARFIADVVRASFQIAGMVLAGRQPTSAVVRVQLRGHNDTYLATTAGFTSLVPGSVGVEALKFSGVLYVHVLDVDRSRPEASLREHELTVLAQEERILRAFASDAELLDAGYDVGWRCQGPTYLRPDAVRLETDRRHRHAAD